jgi:hypothetical protein
MPFAVQLRLPIGFVEIIFDVYVCFLACTRVIVEPAACRIVTSDDVKSLKSKVVSHKSTRCAGIAQLKKFVARSGKLSFCMCFPFSTSLAFYFVDVAKYIIIVSILICFCLVSMCFRRNVNQKQRNVVCSVNHFV